jgi:hypothetical protein
MQAQARQSSADADPSLSVLQVAFALMVVTSPGVVAVEGGVAYASGYNENERVQSASFAPLL